MDEKLILEKIGLMKKFQKEKECLELKTENKVLKNCIKI